MMNESLDNVASIHSKASKGFKFTVTKRYGNSYKIVGEKLCPVTGTVWRSFSYFETETYSNAKKCDQKVNIMRMYENYLISANSTERIAVGY